MADVTEGIAPNTAFAQAAAEAEAAARAAEQADEGQPRDEQGRFVSDEPQTTETVEEPAAVEETTAAKTLLAGKYKTVEDLERAYEEIQAFTARQGTELGELRAAFEQQFQAINDRLDTPPPVQRQITPDLIEQNPAYATQVAFEQQDPQTLAVAFEQWKIEDPAAAAAWVAEKRLEDTEKRLRDEYEQRIAQIEQRVAPIQAQNEQAILAQGVQQLPEDVRAFLSDAQAVQTLAQEFPVIGNAIVSGSTSERINAIVALHGIHRGRTADTLANAVTDVARTTAQEAQAARDEAYVASSTTSEAETLTWEQQQQQEAVEAFTRKRSLWDEALVRPAKQ